MILFNRFLIDVQLSKDLVFDLISHEHTYFHLISVGIVQRTVDDFQYKALQVIIFGLFIAISDAKSKVYPIKTTKISTLP